MRGALRPPLVAAAAVEVRSEGCLDPVLRLVRMAHREPGLVAAQPGDLDSGPGIGVACQSGHALGLFVILGPGFLSRVHSAGVFPGAPRSASGRWVDGIPAGALGGTHL